VAFLFFLARKPLVLALFIHSRQKQRIEIATLPGTSKTICFQTWNCRAVASDKARAAIPSIMGCAYMKNAHAPHFPNNLTPAP
jgi:hypothetical protein